jgi:iron complex transport system permease protein
MRGRSAAGLSGLLLFAAAALLLSPLLGETALRPGALWEDPAASPDAWILRELRLPRAALAFLAGGTLALGGLAFQAMFRNPLATPFTLGVASGASLGHALALACGATGLVLGLPAATWGTFGGALLAIGLVWLLARAKRAFASETLLLAGVAVTFFFSSLILLIQYLSDFAESYRIIRWLMGSLDVVGWEEPMRLLPFAAALALLLAAFAPRLDLLLTGDDLATGRGLDIRRTKEILFLATSLAVGAVVAACGPVGFVGMMAPHIARLLVGPGHRRLVPAAALFGGGFLVLSDALARILIAPATLPVGVLTALLGGPFFLALLLRRGGGRL